MDIDISKLKEEDVVSYGYVKASWLQKCIRRGLVDKAISIAQLYLDDKQQEGLRRKLLVFCYEDIGLGTPEMNLILSQETDLLKQVELLARAQKNRENDRFLLAVRDFYPTLKKNKEIKEEVEILHHLCSLADNWFSDKRNKENKKKLENAFEFLKEEAPKESREIISQAVKDYFLLSKHNSFGARTALAHIVLISLRKIKPIDYKLDNFVGQKIKLPSVDLFALDKHTSFGKKLGKGDLEFYTEGSVIRNERLYESLYLNNGEEKYPYLLWMKNL